VRDEVELDEISWRPCRNTECGSFDFCSQGLVECQDEIRVNGVGRSDHMLVFGIDSRKQSRLYVEPVNWSDVGSTVPQLKLMAKQTMGFELAGEIRRRLFEDRLGYRGPKQPPLA
jgi:hypothetical protein